MNPIRCAPVSVLLSTYSGELAAHLAAALESLYAQSLPPAQIVLVIDGPVDRGQEQVIASFSARSGDIAFDVVRLPVCGGLARALNRGVESCRFDLIARMDSDDITPPERISKQFEFLQHHAEVDVLAGWQAEFEGTDHSIVRSVKETPAGHNEIARALKWRNVISHPTIILRKQKLLAVGGYDQDVGLLEDYDLHMRLIHAGARYAALQEPMVYVRVSPKQRARRGGWRYVMNEWVFRYRCYRRGNMTLWDFLITSAVNTVFRLLPSFVKDPLYRLVRSSAA